QRDDVAGAKGDRRKLLRRYRAVGPVGDDDGVIPLRVHDDRGRAGCYPRRAPHPAGIHPGAAEVFEVPAAVVPHGADHGGRRPRGGRGNGLVPTLPAGHRRGGDRVDRFAHPGMGGHGVHGVDVQRPDDENAPAHGNTLKNNSRYRAPSAFVTTSIRGRASRAAASSVPAKPRRSTTVCPRVTPGARHTDTGAGRTCAPAGSRTAQTAPASPSATVPGVARSVVAVVPARWVRSPPMNWLSGSGESLSRAASA